MKSTARVTVTLPTELVERIDELDRNRSRFVAQAVVRELACRRRAGLLRSLRNPHPEAAELAKAELAGWGASLPTGDEGLVDPSAGKLVCWVAGRGWVKKARAKRVIASAPAASRHARGRRA